MLEFMKLELRKQRNFLVTLLGLCLGGVALLGPAIAMAQGSSWLAGSAMMAFAWALCAPLTAVIFGGASGAGLRLEPAAPAEALLPVSPGRKLAGALAASLAGWLLLAGTGYALLGALSSRLPSAIFSGSGVREAGLFGLLLLPVGLLLLLNAFAFSYASRQGLLGGLLALMAGVLVAGGLGLGFTLRMSAHWGVSTGADGWSAGAILLAAFAGPAFALVRLARWGERRMLPGAAGWGLIGLGLGAGALAAALWCSSGYSALRKQLLFDRDDLYPVAFTDAAVPIAGKPALLETREGALVAAGADGKRVALLAGESRNPFDLIRRGGVNRIASLAWDDDGTLWVLVRSELVFSDNALQTRKFELWHGSADAALKAHSFFTAPEGLTPGGFARRDGRLVLLAAPERRGAAQFAFLPAAGKAPQFSAPAGESGAPWIGREEMRDAIRSGELAYASKDGRALARWISEQESRLCELPEGTKAKEAAFGTPRRGVAGHRFYLLPVVMPDGGAAVARCLEDGSVSLVRRSAVRGAKLQLAQTAPGSWFRFDAPPASAVAGVSVQAEWQVYTPEGEPLPPLKVDDARLAGWLGHAPSPDERALMPLVMIGSRLWVAAGDDLLLEIETGDGSLVRRMGLPGAAVTGSKRGWYAKFLKDGAGIPTASGFFYIAGGRLYHAGFDGNKVADLGRASR